jgi:hypothetical protein
MKKFGWGSKAHYEELHGINDAEVDFVVEPCNGFEVHPKKDFKHGGYFEMHNPDPPVEGTMHSEQEWGTLTIDQQTGIPTSTREHYTLRVEGLSWWSTMYHP